jgi:hypothetical protein
MSHLVEGTKHDEGKPRFDLIPVMPMFELAKLYAIGAKKYDDRNWEKGISWGRIFRALLSHAFKWWAGQKYDQEDGQHHLASVAWCAFALMEYERTRPEYDDRQSYPLGEDDIAKSTLEDTQSKKVVLQKNKNKVSPKPKKMRRSRRRKM